jgi:hypothetical protein
VWACVCRIQEGLVQVFGEVSSFFDMGLSFLNIGLDIVPKLLDKRMVNHKSLELKRLVAFGKSLCQF